MPLSVWAATALAKALVSAYGFTRAVNGLEAVDTDLLGPDHFRQLQ